MFRRCKRSRCNRGSAIFRTDIDLLSQAQTYGGMGLGTIVTSAVFLAIIVVLVAFLSLGVNVSRAEAEEG